MCFPKNYFTKKRDETVVTFREFQIFVVVVLQEMTTN